MAGPNENRPGWVARWYMWDGGFLAMGESAGAVPPHDHHALQVAIPLEGRVALQVEDGEWHEYAAFMVAPDFRHAFNGLGNAVAMLFVDPETIEGRWLRRTIGESIACEVPAERLEPCVASLRSLWEKPTDAVTTARVIDGIVRTLCTGPRPLRTLDPRILRALEFVRRADVAALSLEEVAGTVFLSGSRFAHLFKEQLGLPFRRYLLWRKLTRALLMVVRGKTLSVAAHTAGFADSAHLTRTCYQMFGISPSLLIGRGEYHEIPAPFELPIASA
jgi:AraC family transcriptional regulator